MSSNKSKWPWKYDFVPNLDAREFFAKGEEELDKGDWLSALASFERAVQLECSPVHCSFLALCIAKERGLYLQAIAICEEAIAMEPANPVHYLNLGRIHLLRGEKGDGIRVFREGLKAGRHPRIIVEMEKLGIRKPPVIPFLSRDSPINKYLGKIFSRLAIR
jgi:tetratricopeptide (TPR) repeat protein